MEKYFSQVTTLHMFKASRYRIALFLMINKFSVSIFPNKKSDL